MFTYYGGGVDEVDRGRWGRWDGLGVRGSVFRVGPEPLQSWLGTGRNGGEMAKVFIGKQSQTFYC